MSLRNLRFRTKLFLGFVIVIAFCLFISLFALSNLSKIEKNTELIYKHPFAVSNAVRDIKMCINGMHRSMKDVVLAENTEELNAATKDIEKLNKQALDAFDLVFERFLGNIQDVKKAYKAFVDWEQVRNEAIKLKQEGKDAEAAQITKGRGAKHIADLLEKTNIMTDFAQLKVTGFKEEVQKTYAYTFQTLLITMIFVLVLSIGIALVISKSILSPIHKFIAGIRALYLKEDKLSYDFSYASEAELLSMTISELKNVYGQLKNANDELLALNEDLDEKVMSRTAELAKNQIELKEKNEEYQAINEEYESLNEELMHTNKQLAVAKEKAEESEIYLERVINNIGDPVFVKDDQSRLRIR